MSDRPVYDKLIELAKTLREQTGPGDRVLHMGKKFIDELIAEAETPRRGIDSSSAQAHIQEALWPYLRDGVGYEASDAVIEVLKELEKPTC